LLITNNNRFKRAAVSVEEAAEHFIKFQSKNLNTDQQALQSHDKHVTNDYNQQVTYSAAHLGQREYDHHHTGMDKHERADTQKAHGVGCVAEKELEYFKEVLDNKISPTFGFPIRPALNKLSQNFPEHHRNKGKDNQADNIYRGHDLPPEYDLPAETDDQRYVENQAGKSVRAEQSIVIMFPPERGIDVDQYCDDHQTDADSDRRIDDRVGRGRLHYLNRFLIQTEKKLVKRIQCVFKSEYRTESRSEYRGRNAAWDQDSAEFHFQLVPHEPSH
jgi:hypothetical protein